MTVFFLVKLNVEGSTTRQDDQARCRHKDVVLTTKHLAAPTLRRATAQQQKASPTPTMTD